MKLCCTKNIKSFWLSYKLLFKNSNINEMKQAFNFLMYSFEKEKIIFWHEFFGKRRILKCLICIQLLLPHFRVSGMWGKAAIPNNPNVLHFKKTWQTSKLKLKWYKETEQEQNNKKKPKKSFFKKRTQNWNKWNFY